jgi:hypothetical protein
MHQRIAQALARTPQPPLGTGARPSRAGGRPKRAVRRGPERLLGTTVGASLNPLVAADSAVRAEGEGFEPSVDRKAHNGFRDQGGLDRARGTTRIRDNRRCIEGLLLGAGSRRCRAAGAAYLRGRRPSLRRRGEASRNRRESAAIGGYRRDFRH